jgi:peptidoglycan hydrolase-like protein with peptidoglycan-binding domain
MKTQLLVCSMLTLALAGCARNAPPVVAEAPPVPQAAAPTPLAAPEPAPAVDPALLAAAQTQLRALGYAAGKSGDTKDPAFEKAVAEFQKDQGLAQDGEVTQALLDRMKTARAELARAAQIARNASFTYDDGASTRQAMGLLIAPPPGLTANAPANFLQPLRPGVQASYQLGKRAQDGSFAPAMTVTCRASRAAPANLPLGTQNVITVDCRGDSAQPLQWRSLYSPSLGLVVRQERGGAAHNLVAVRPFTGDWPAAARTGLDWALTHALSDMPAGTPVQWSSTGVTPHFEIKAGVKLPGQEAGLAGKNAALSCRRFDMVQTGPGGVRYPGIACQGRNGWYLPGTSIPFAAPANGVAVKLPAGLRSAQK